MGNSFSQILSDGMADAKWIVGRSSRGIEYGKWMATKFLMGWAKENYLSVDMIFFRFPRTIIVKCYWYATMATASNGDVEAL